MKTFYMFTYDNYGNQIKNLRNVSHSTDRKRQSWNDETADQQKWIIYLVKINICCFQLLKCENVLFPVTMNWIFVGWMKQDVKTCCWLDLVKELKLQLTLQPETINTSLWALAASDWLLTDTQEGVWGGTSETSTSRVGVTCWNVTGVEETSRLMRWWNRWSCFRLRSRWVNTERNCTQAARVHLKINFSKLKVWTQSERIHFLMKRTMMKSDPNIILWIVSAVFDSTLKL